MTDELIPEEDLWREPPLRLFNKNHDPKTGRFTTSKGGGSGLAKIVDQWDIGRISGGRYVEPEKEPGKKTVADQDESERTKRFSGAKGVDEYDKALLEDYDWAHKEENSWGDWPDPGIVFRKPKMSPDEYADNWYGRGKGEKFTKRYGKTRAKWNLRNTRQEGATKGYDDYYDAIEKRIDDSDAPDWVSQADLPKWKPL